MCESGNCVDKAIKQYQEKQFFGDETGFILLALVIWAAQHALCTSISSVSSMLGIANEL